MATPVTLEQVLGYVALTGVIQGTTSGIPFPLPDGFMSVKRPTIGDSARYTRVTGTRRTARLAMYGSPAVKRELKDVSYVDVKLMHSFESQLMNPLVLQQLRNFNDYNIQRLGMDEIVRQVTEFKQLFSNLRIASILQMLSSGAIYFDGDGHMLPSSSGAVVSITFGMSANNQTQLNGIISATWASATTDIPGQLRLLRDRAAQLTGYELKYAFYGSGVPSSMTNNDYVLDYLARNNNMQSAFLDSAELPEGLFGFTWVPVHTSFFEDQNSTNQTIFGANKVVFTPDVDSSWYEMIEGTYMVPSTINIVADASAAMSSMQQVEGMFGYSAVSHNPPTIQSFFGDTFLPVLKVPDSVFQAETVF